MQQQEHQARLAGHWFDLHENYDDDDDEDDDEDEGEEDENGNGNHPTFGTTDHAATTTTTTGSNESPNSLAEWVRTVNLEPLLQRREAIHREKREGKPSHRRRSDHPSSVYTNKTPLSTKEYLSNLAKSIQEPSSSSSTLYLNNVQVKELYLASKQADQLGEYTVAQRLLETLVRVTPNDARIYRRLARLAVEQGNVSKARAWLHLGLRRLPFNGFLWHGLGQLELKEGAESQARKYFQKAIQVDPGLPHSYHALGTMEHTQGHIAEAMKVLKKGVEYCPTNHRLHHALGDLYRGAKLLKDAERSYRRALEHGPLVSQCFAYSALAAVAYEKRDLEECRFWLRKSVALNNGRHAQGWVSMAQMEESEGNIDTARSICIAAINQYERGLIEMKQRYKRQFQRHQGIAGGREHVLMAEQMETSPSSNASNPLELKNQLLLSVPKYRSGDRFLKVYRNWARLEERYGNFETVDEVYSRASIAFPQEFKITLDWAEYHSSMMNNERARSLFLEASNKALSRYGIICM